MYCVHVIYVYIHIYIYIRVYIYYTQLYTYICVCVSISTCVSPHVYGHIQNHNDWVSRVFMRVAYEILKTPAFLNGARVLKAKTWAKCQE